MKYLRFILFLFMPFIVFAKINSVEVVSIERLEKSDNVIVIEDEEVSNSTVHFALKFFEVDDYVTYKVVIKNVSGDKIKIKKNEDVLKSKYLSYEASLEDDELEIDEQTELLLRVEYYNNVEREDISSGRYVEEQDIDLNIVNGELMISNTGVIDFDEDAPLNPLTRDFIVGVVLISGASLIMYVIFKKKKVAKYTLLLILLLPIYTSAVDSIKVNSIIEVKLVKPNPCTYEGELVDGATYEKDEYDYIYISAEEGWRLSLRDRNSTDPVTSKICTTVNGKPIVSMSGTFANSKTTAIDLSSFDTSNVIAMDGMFYYATNLEEVDLITFDVRNVENMASMFYNDNISEYDFSGFETNSLTNVSSMLGNNGNIVELDVSNWDTSKIESMGNFIGNTTSLKKLNISNWDFTSFDVSGKFEALLGGYYTQAKEVIADNVNFGTNMKNAFMHLKNVEELSLENANTSRVTTMANAFEGLSKIKELDLSGWDTSNVTDMNRMFRYMYSLETLNLSNWDFSSFDVSYGLMLAIIYYAPVKHLVLDNAKFGESMSGCFRNLNSLEDISLKDVDTSATTKMSEMFEDYKLTELDLSSFDTENVTQVNGAFEGATNLKSLNLSNWNFTSFPENNGSPLRQAFFNLPDETLESINLSNAVFGSSMNHFFYDFIYLKEIDLTNSDTSRVTDMSYAFGKLHSITELDLSSWDTSNVTNMSYMFYEVKSITDLDVTSFNTSNVTDMSGMFNYVESVENIDVSKFDVSKVTNMNHMFSSMTSLKEIDVSTFETSSLTKMEDFISYCPKLTELDLSSFDTSHFTGMPWYIMFGDVNIETLNLSNWDMTSFSNNTNVMGRMLGGSSYAFNSSEYSYTYHIKKIIAQNVIFPTTVTAMFAGMPMVEEIDLTGADTSRTTNMREMFSGDRGIKILDVSMFDTSKVTEMGYMFSNMNALESLNVSGFDTSNVTTMESMFASTNALTVLDLSSFDISKVTAKYNIFYDTGATTGYAKDQASADFFNTYAPSTLRFTVK